MLSFSTRHIDVIMNNSWRFSCVYGRHEDAQKYLTWDLLSTLSAVSSFPWLCGGNFNKVLYSHEKEGGNNKDLRRLYAFHSALDRCSLDDLGFKGYCFTWSNGQGGIHNIEESLDHFVASND